MLPLPRPQARRWYCLSTVLVIHNFLHFSPLLTYTQQQPERAPSPVRHSVDLTAAAVTMRRHRSGAQRQALRLPAPGPVAVLTARLAATVAGHLAVVVVLVVVADGARAEVDLLLLLLRLPRVAVGGEAVVAAAGALAVVIQPHPILPHRFPPTLAEAAAGAQAFVPTLSLLARTAKTMTTTTPIAMERAVAAAIGPLPNALAATPSGLAGPPNRGGRALRLGVGDRCRPRRMWVPPSRCPLDRVVPLPVVDGEVVAVVL
jgi:hypothetical protein